jgi:hypothetical protein
MGINRPRAKGTAWPAIPGRIWPTRATPPDPSEWR